MSEGHGEPIVAVLEETWSATAEACRGLPPEAWELATDCPGWTVRDQLSHLVGTELGLLGSETPPLPDPMPGYVRNPLGQLNEAWIEARRGVPGDDVLAEFVAVTSRRIEELKGFAPERWEVVGWSPGGEAPYREFMNIRAFDSWMHDQDIRRAVDRPGDRFTKGAESRALTRVTLALGFVVGRKVAPADRTTVVFELVGPISRHLAVAWERPRQRPRRVRGAPTTSGSPCGPSTSSGSVVAGRRRTRCSAPEKSRSTGTKSSGPESSRRWTS